ncbi:methylated-DNA--[protein]-cysteine S-methyltransferase [Streptomyces sp. SPB074]|uniref:methylated-DNA--[protein]-cysteine S-methyltransferase n=1 Tax=Streptomyces sp. (strain SPB074) TaxID=465543 RepID=UPI0002D5FE21|nr:methylated-DNA--[protein]-cysteine S-methyltransferase [Streptomyces sp. SPB074]
MHRVHTQTDSPCGTLTLVATDGLLSGLYLPRHRHRPPEETFGARDERPFGAALDQLGAYFAGELTTFDVPLHQEGTSFQRTVWDALVAIPYGETRSYGQLAAALGKPGASRAVGLANGRNPVSIIVPCHRVVGANGSLTGYAGGVETKKALLAFERGRTRTPGSGSLGEDTLFALS